MSSPQVATVSETALATSYLAERDLLIFQQRRSGQSSSDIAKSFRLSTAAVNAAIGRQLAKMNREALLAYPEVLRMELERIDKLQEQVWRLAQWRTVEINGEKIVVEPDLKAVAILLTIIATRSKLMGLDRIAAQDSGGSSAGSGAQVVENIRSSIHGAPENDQDAHDARSETIALLRLSGSSGVFDEEYVADMLAKLEGGEELLALEAPAKDQIDDAEIVEIQNEG